MLQASTKYLCTAVCLVACFVYVDPADAGQRVKVKLADGNVVVAEIDQRTSGERLWLRFKGVTVVALRPIPWTKVVSLTVLPRHAVAANQERSATANSGGPSFARQAQQALGGAKPSVTTFVP